MRAKLGVLWFVLVSACAAPASPPPRAPAAASVVSELDVWRARAQRVTITRDDWGIPHVRGPSDADAVFGLMYAQAEDDFPRIEHNFLLSLGRLAEAEGEQEVWRDLRMQLFIDPADLQARYRACEPWLKALLDAWADGLNYFLATRHDVKPRVLTRFEPWMALSFSEGSIGGDIERVSLAELQAFYERSAPAPAPPGPPAPAREPSGSNGFAIAPARSASSRALLWINPHTSFFFRAEAQVTSDEGLNAYGALTWGQFFVYQGFNERAGWMHTSSGVDNIDEYSETIKNDGGRLLYAYGDEQRELRTRRVQLRYKHESGLATRELVAYRSHHGPIVRAQAGKWISVRLMEEPVKALTQSYLRTKAKNLDEFLRVMQLHANSSNNTVFADADGNIAYLHANFVPTRNPALDWTLPVDGSDPATEWGELQSVEAAPNAINPRTGWVYNTNDAPWNAAGADSPKQADHPSYVDRSGENPRGVAAVELLGARDKLTPQDVIDVAFDPRLHGFDRSIPALAAAFRRAKPRDAALLEPLRVLERWDRRWAADSVATTLAVLWAEELLARVTAAASGARMHAYQYMQERASDRERLDALAVVANRLRADFGSWQVPWGDINRFQRLNADVGSKFDDAAPSLPVPFVSGRWGSLAAYGSVRQGINKKLYGVSGNSFLAIVEFGERVRARAISAGGQSGDVRSPHFADQAERYVRGDLREVYFYPSQLEGHSERSYKPGS